MIFPELSFETRIKKVASAGFGRIEIWDWRDKNLEALASACADLDMAITNMSGQRSGSLVSPNEFTLYKNEVLSSIHAAEKISCNNLMLLTNPLDSEGKVLDTYPDIPEQEKWDTCVNALSELAPLTTEHKIHLLVEPLNTLIDHAGYWLDDGNCAFEIIRSVGCPHIRLLYDCYHMQAMGRNVCKDIEEHLDLIGYLHAADYPGRHEPGTGNMDYDSTFKLLEELGYAEIVGFEFSPLRSSAEALEKTHDLVEPYL
jgi:hydroxypyruvate isomerase